GPSHGTATVISGGTQIQYTPSSVGSDTFVYRLTDSLGNTVLGNVTVNAGTVSIPQVINLGANAVIANAVGDSVTVNPLANDTNLLGYALSITGVSTPTHGTA